MNINDRREGAELASTLLRLPVDQVLAYSREIPDIDAFFYWQPVRGGAQLIVGRDGTVLFGVSALNLDEMVVRFAAGHRTEPWKFEVEESSSGPASHSGGTAARSAADSSTSRTS